MKHMTLRVVGAVLLRLTDFRHAFLGSTQWGGDWSYGEDLSFVQP